MAALWLARASSQLARRAARRLPPLPSRHGGETSPWLLGSSAAAPPPVLGSPPLPPLERIVRRGFCSVRRFAGESSAAAAAADEEEPENGFAGGDQVMRPRPPRALASVMLLDFCIPRPP